MKLTGLKYRNTKFRNNASLPRTRILQSTPHLHAKRYLLSDKTSLTAAFAHAETERDTERGKMKAEIKQRQSKVR